MTRKEIDYALGKVTYWSDDIHKVCFINNISIIIFYTSYYFIKENKYLVFKKDDIDVAAFESNKIRDIKNLINGNKII